MSGRNQLTVRTANGSALAAWSAFTARTSTDVAPHVPASMYASPESDVCRKASKLRPRGTDRRSAADGSLRPRSLGTRLPRDRLGEK